MFLWPIIHAKRPWVILWFIVFLSSSEGKNTNFVFPEFPNILRVSKYLIYIAVLLSKISAASLINFADSTSALAEINLDSASLLSFAADDKESCKS